jgi:hypothetical protein
VFYQHFFDLVGGDLMQPFTDFFMVVLNYSISTLLREVLGEWWLALSAGFR